VKHPNPRALFTPEYFIELIEEHMAEMDPPVAYGQHINAEIASQMQDSTELLDSVLSLTPQKAAGGAASAESGELRLIADLLSRLRPQVDVRALRQKIKGDENPLNVVLTQELQRYNVLLARVRRGLEQLEQGIKGLVVISPELEAVQGALRDGKVPLAWGFAYFSLKPLANWFEDLGDRYDFLTNWAQKTLPFHFWIGAFTYPTGFTTSLQQRYSRKGGAPPIDKLEFDFVPVAKLPGEITEHPKDGAYVTGLYLEGAKWNLEKMTLCEPEVMQLACPMPVVHFKPIQKRPKALPNMYACPCYYYPKREGTVDKDSWMLTVELKSGEEKPGVPIPQEFWIKRGTALLMSLAN